MNFQHLNFDYVEVPRQGPPTYSTDQSHHDYDEDEESSLPTLRPYYDLSHRVGNRSNRDSFSPQAAVLHAPSPPSLSASTTEIYGPNRLFPGGPPMPAGLAPRPPQSSAQYAPPHQPLPRLPPPPRSPSESTVRFDEAQLAMFAAENSARMANIKDELTIAAGKVTPGVDDTPYIQYALEALTRNRGGPAPAHFPSSDDDDEEEYSEDDYAQPRRLPDDQRDFPLLTPAPAYVEDRLPAESPELPERFAIPDTAERAEPTQNGPGPESSNETVVHHDHPNRLSSPTRSHQSDEEDLSDPVVSARQNRRSKSIPVERAHPPLDFKPLILRPFSMLILMILTGLMAAALVFAAIYSDSGDGLTPYPGSIYSGQYFLFRILPQMLAAIILIYAQCIVATSQRILPFVAMASDEPSLRYLALFRDLYPKTFLLPSLSGPWQFQLFSVATWLLNFTIPLQSTAFTCIYHDQKWVWAAVQGVVWTLVAMYIVMIVATIVLMVFWFRQWTGLLWDVRSVGHLLPLLSQSNTTKSYENIDVLQRGTLFKAQLRDRHLDRLGYWQVDGQPLGSMWYGIGSMGDSDNRQNSYSVVAKASYMISPASSRDDLEAEAQYKRHRYLPIALRNATLIGSLALMTSIVVAILIVSFMPQTRIDNGFLPKLSARPGKGAFSAANFLYGFLPSLVGMIMFLLFQGLDHSLRRHQPWADMSKASGSIAQKSLLADYAACLPFQVTFKAARNGHWRVAVLSFMSLLFVFIPILSGGLFMALTNVRGQVRMFPNMPVFGVLLAFLFLFVGCLCLMLPGRQALRLPHPVSCVAELITLCAADETTQDPAFRGIRSAEELEARLGLDRTDRREQTMWYFGVSTGRDERRLSVRPFKRFTEKRMRSSRSMR